MSRADPFSRAPEGSPRCERLLAGIAALALAGCGARVPAPEPGPLPAPDLTVASELSPGSALSGPGRPPAEDDGSRLVVELRLLYVEHGGSEGFGEALQPIEPASLLVVDLLGPRPLLFGPTLAAGAGYASGEAATRLAAALDGGAAGRLVELAAETAVVPGGATLTVAASAPETVEDPLDWLDEYRDRGPIERRVAIALTAAPDGPEVALSIDDLDPVAEEERIARAREATVVRAGPPGPPGEEVLRRETLVLEVAPAPGAPLVLAWPSPFASGEGEAFVAILGVSDREASAEGITAARARMASATERHLQRTAPLVSEGIERLRRRAARHAFRARGGRPALLLLAEEADAPLTADLALFAEEDLLAELSAEAFAAGAGAGRAPVGGSADAPAGDPASVAEGDSPAGAADAPAGDATSVSEDESAHDSAGDPADASAGDPVGDPADESVVDSADETADDVGAVPEPEGDPGFGWRLERSAWRVLCRRALQEQLDDPGLAALLRHAGAVGRFPDLLLDALAASPDRGAFEERLATEQRFFLDDPDPAARLRAHDWMGARGRAVPGYEPLGPREDRRAALRAAEQAPAVAPPRAVEGAPGTATEADADATPGSSDAGASKG